LAQVGRQLDHTLLSEITAEGILLRSQFNAQSSGEVDRQGVCEGYLLALCEDALNEKMLCWGNRNGYVPEYRREDLLGDPS